MSLPKAVYDPAKKSRNLVTTISGIVTLILSILVGFGVINLDQQGELQGYASTLIEAGVAIYGVVIGIINMFFAEDPA